MSVSDDSCPAQPSLARALLVLAALLVALLVFVFVFVFVFVAARLLEGGRNSLIV